MPNHWNTLASSNLDRTRAFYEALGFEVQSGPPGVPCVVVKPAPDITICFFIEAAFARMTFGRAVDASASQELVQSLGYTDRDEVDELVAAAEAAGAPETRPGIQQPWGYGGGFSDPDGHVWAALWMPR